jgi:hypothetical protein
MTYAFGGRHGWEFGRAITDRPYKIISEGNTATFHFQLSILNYQLSMFLSRGMI